MPSASVCVHVCVCDGTIERWETQIVARLSGYGCVVPLRLDYMFQLHATLLFGAGHGQGV